MLKLKQLTLRIESLEMKVEEMQNIIGDLMLDNAMLKRVNESKIKKTAPKLEKPTAEPKKRGRKPKNIKK